METLFSEIAIHINCQWPNNRARSQYQKTKMCIIMAPSFSPIRAIDSWVSTVIILLCVVVVVAGYAPPLAILVRLALLCDSPKPSITYGATKHIHQYISILLFTKFVGIFTCHDFVWEQGWDARISRTSLFKWRLRLKGHIPNWNTLASLPLSPLYAVIWQYRRQVGSTQQVSGIIQFKVSAVLKILIFNFPGNLTKWRLFHYTPNLWVWCWLRLLPSTKLRYTQYWFSIIKPLNGKA